MRHGEPATDCHFKLAVYLATFARAQNEDSFSALAQAVRTTLKAEALFIVRSVAPADIHKRLESVITAEYLSLQVPQVIHVPMAEYSRW